MRSSLPVRLREAAEPLGSELVIEKTYAIFQRRACGLVSVDPKTVRREAVPDNPEARSRMREIAAVRRPVHLILWDMTALLGAAAIAEAGTA